MTFTTPAFELEPTIALIQFEGRWSGLEIQCSLDIDIDHFFAMQAQNERLQKAQADGNQREVLRSALEFLIANTAPSWNLTKDGQPVPLTLDAVMALPANLLLQIVPKYAQAIEGAYGVDAPLEEPSSDGVPSADLQMPTESL